MIKVEEVRDGETFAGLKEDWSLLLEKAEGATIFSSHEWLSQWWRCFGSAGNLRVLLARNSRGEIQGALPLFHSRPPVFRLRLLRALTLLGQGVSDYGDLLAPAEEIPAVSDALLAHLAEDVDRYWDIMTLSAVPPASRAATEIVRAARDRGLPTWTEAGEPTAYLALPPTPDLLDETLPGIVRRTLSRMERKLERQPDWGLTILEDERELPPAMESLFELHQLRQRGMGHRGAFADERVRAFHQNVAREFLHRGWLRLLFIEIEGRRAAGIYGFLFRDVLYYYIPGFDPRWKKYSPGTLCLGLFIKQGIKEGARVCDFLRGGEAYKSHWGTSSTRNLRVIVLRNRARYSLHRSLEGVRSIPRLWRNSERKA